MSAFGAPFGSGDGDSEPFQGILGDIARLLGAGSGPLNFDLARQVAVLLASGGGEQANVEPVTRINFEELAHVAQLHVEAITGETVSPRNVECVTTVDWAVRSLDDYRLILIGLAQSLGRVSPASAGGTAGTNDGETGQGREIESFMVPALLGMQVGGMIGHLALRTLGQYEIPIPRPNNSTLVFVPSNIDQLASDWSLPVDQLRMHVVLEEVVRFSVLSRPHIGERLSALINEYVAGFRPDQSPLLGRLTEFATEEPGQLPEVLSDGDLLMGEITTPEQQVVLKRLSAAIAALVGYTDWIVAAIAPKLVPTAGAIAEANKRRRVEETNGSRLVERLLGLELGQRQFDLGASFVDGVLKRADGDALSRLWQSADNLPTPSEIEAPGLWLARIDYPVREID